MRVAAFITEAKVTGRNTAVLRLVEPGPEKATVANTEETEGVGVTVPWNPLSFASARAALIETETALDGVLDELVIFADPPTDATSITGLTPRFIEHAILEWAAGYAELIREAAKRFAERGGGSIVLVIVQAERGPLGAMASGALIGLAEGIFFAGTPTVRFSAIRDESGQADLLARHVVKTLDEPSRDPGKIQRFGNRPGFFGR
ncbi:MAG: hypothetical protein A2Y38_03545 [Spirochaetes bacterium GWB1_59_5]|nr:MAG: hypothetical protein A2Y38_03545 [Spirochaetes bacterium GWB1_59_5]